MLDPREIFDIKEDKVIAKKDCFVLVNRSDYRDEDIIEFSDRYRLPPIFEFYFEDSDESTYLIFPYNQVDLIKSSNFDDDDDTGTIKIFYSEGDIVIFSKSVEANFDLRSVARIIEGRVRYIKNPLVLYNILHSALPTIDTVHLELVISNMIRNPDGKLARHTGDFDNIEIIGVTEQSKNDSWLSAISFQHVEQGISKALVKNEDADMNPIEKIINEEFDRL